MQELKPMDFGIILDKMFKLVFTKNYLKTFLIFFGSYFLLALIIGLVIFSAFGFSFENFSNIRMLSNLPLFLIAGMTGALLFLFLFFLFTGICTDLFSKTFLEKPWDLAASIKFSIGRIVHILSYGLIYLLINIIPVVIFVVAAVIMGINLSREFSGHGSNLFFILIISAYLFFIIFMTAIYTLSSLGIPAIIFEKKNGFNALMRSFSLVRSNFWRVLFANILFNIIITFVVYAVMIVVIIAILIIFVIIAVAAKFNMTSNPAFITAIMITYFFLIIMISSVIIGPYYAFNVLVFFNQKIKHEGFGIEFLAESMMENSVPASDAKSLENENKMSPADNQD